jgi:hypothetical protein
MQPPLSAAGEERVDQRSVVGVSYGAPMHYATHIISLLYLTHPVISSSPPFPRRLRRRGGGDELSETTMRFQHHNNNNILCKSMRYYSVVK